MLIATSNPTMCGFGTPPFARQCGLLLAALCLCAVGCGASSHPRPNAPGPGQEQQAAIGDIKLVGADHMDDSEIKDGLGVVRAKELGQPFAAYMVALDRQRIQGFYDRRGYFAASVESTIARTPGRADVTFTVVEGARAKLARVDVIGLPPDSPITPAELRDKLPLQDGDSFNYEVYDLARPDLVKALQEKGFATASVSGLVLADREKSEAILRLTVDLGPLSTFGKITVEGVEGKLADSVRDRLRFKEGEQYSQQKVEDTRGDLYEYGRFAYVRIELEPQHRDPVVPVRISLGLAPPNDLRLGGGVGANSLSYEIRAQAIYARAGWPTTLTSTRLELRPAVIFLRDDAGDGPQPRIDAIAGLDRVDLFLPRVRGLAEAGFTYQTLEAFTNYGPRLRLGLRAPIYRRIIQGAVGWQLQLLDFTDLDPALTTGENETPNDNATALSLQDSDRIGLYEQSIFVELRDNPLIPKRGAYAELRFEEGTAAAGGEFRYVRILPDVRGYISLGDITFAARGRLGITFGDLPITQRFFGGGANSQRGFAERQLSPFVTDTSDDGASTEKVVVGGTSSLELSAEVRFPLFHIRTLPIGGVVFLDGADVTNQADELKVSKLHLASGGGIRAITPIGSVRFDVGVRLNRRGVNEPSGDSRFAYHLSIGEAF
jgi:outer membrane protein assembly factor BamA